MTTMLALHQNRYGDVATEEIILGHLPKPSPTPSQVLIKVHAAALNPIDLKRNDMKLEDNFPIVVGYDVAGVIEQIGADVTRFKVGDRVYANVMPHPLGPKLSGSVAEYATCEESLLAIVPQSASFVEAAAVPLVAQTAVEGLTLTGCKKGDKVFVSAGAGGVGIHLIQIAKRLFGASEVATTASGAKIEFVKKYGADRVVDYRKEDAGEVLKQWADIAFDCTRETDMEKKILKPGGRLVSIAEFEKPVPNFKVSPTPEIIEKVASVFEDGRLEVVIDSVYSLADAKKAVEHLAAGKAKGKIVIKICD